MSVAVASSPTQEKDSARGPGDADGSPSIGLVPLPAGSWGSWNAHVDPAVPGLCCELCLAIHLALLTWESSSIPAPERLVLNICCGFGWDEGFQVG